METKTFNVSKQYIHLYIMKAHATCIYREGAAERTTAGENVGVCGVDNDGADVVRVGFKRVDLLQSVIVEHSHHHVVLEEGGERLNDGPMEMAETAVLLDLQIL